MTRQRYVSNELTHFLGRSLADDEERYALLIKVLNTGQLTHFPHDPDIRYHRKENLQAGISSNERFEPGAICFCDIPVDDLGLHIAKYSPFGLAFRKAYLVPKGANPVFYIARGSLVKRTLIHGKRTLPRSDYFDRMGREYERLRMELFRRAEGDAAATDAWAQFDTFVQNYLFAFFKFFDSDLPEDHPDNFYMEREWRVWGHVDFSLLDVRRIIVPEAFAARLRQDVPAFAAQVSFAPTLLSR